MRIGSVFLSLVLVLNLLLAGCQTSTPPLTAVTGTVAYRGQPLPRGLIVFTPDSSKGSNGPSASAVIQADGSFVLQTDNSAGAPVGWHIITVVSVSDPEPSANGFSYSMPVSLIPERYRSPDLSGLSREVRAGQKNEINLNLD